MQLYAVRNKDNFRFRLGIRESHYHKRTRDLFLSDCKPEVKMSINPDAETHRDMENAALADQSEDGTRRFRDDLINEVYSVAAGQATMEMAGIRAELQILEPLFKEAIQLENAGASPGQLQAMVSAKLQQTADLIPRRQRAERLADLELNVIRQNLTQFKAIIDQLQSKTIDDVSARLEWFQAKRILAEIEATRLPLVERKFQEATGVWYKPGVDPIDSAYSEILAELSRLGAIMDYERSLRPELEELVPDYPSEEPGRQPNPNCNTMVLFDAAKFISKFRGDLKEPNVLLQFSNWNSSWSNLVKEMKTLRGFNQTSLFLKLKDCLAGPALLMVSRYSCESDNSYAAAMNDLKEKFADPISLAGSYIASGTAPRDNLADQTDAIKQSFKALRNMRDVFEREEVDMNDFGLLWTFVSSLPTEAQAQWNKFKIQKRQEYKAKAEAASKGGNPLPEWKAGMVECYAQFEPWLDLHAVPLAQPIPVLGPDPTESVSTGANFAVQTRTLGDGQCFICTRDRNQPMTTCPRALGMTSRDWFFACKKVQRCSRCLSSFEPGHRCTIICSICESKGQRSDHFGAICPFNQLRTGPITGSSIRPPQTSDYRPRANKRPRDLPSEHALSKQVRDLNQKIQTLQEEVKNRKVRKVPRKDNKEGKK
ncbi:uncharacterized protein LOC131891701 [Tigriopus californicus]|uniref:uncharacterized protein LOC131891701 n=1 Tax=Tigriopus californicus TaxID=6832 RepID=UPI0027DA864E|nr:uncharacterized protein LOC131891701 [Tigriopus californicus]